MGHNRAGVKARARKKRRIKEENRLIAKEAGAAEAKPKAKATS
jgi:hypothetical protein